MPFEEAKKWAQDREEGSEFHGLTLADTAIESMASAASALRQIAEDKDIFPSTRVQAADSLARLALGMMRISDGGRKASKAERDLFDAPKGPNLGPWKLAVVR